MGKSQKTKKEIYKSIRLNITSHRIKPGQTIREEELAEKYGISRTPIREILQRLEAEGLVNIVPYKGTVVTEITTKDIKEILDVRIALESLAVRLASVKITDERAFTSFREIDALLDRTIQKESVELSFEADNRLHRLILEVADNKRAQKFINNLLSQIQRIRYISGYAPGRVVEASNEHKQIIQAVLSKDPALAEKRMREHLEGTKKLLLESSEKEERFGRISSFDGNELSAHRLDV